MQLISLCSVILLLFTAIIDARKSYYGIDYHAKAAYFSFEYNGANPYVFALNAVDNGDVYFHMSGPVEHCWLGVGFGSQMKDAFMLIAYPSADGQKVTISPRIATGHTEPVYDSSYEIIKVQNDTYGPNANTVTEGGTGTIVAHAVCLNCTRWATGFLDTKNPEQPFIFALGPNVTFRSDALDASIPRHGLVGQFAMDMTEATNYTGWYGRVPAPNIPDFVFPPNDTAFASANSEPAFNVQTMDNPMPGAHAALMCVAFVLIFPSGALILPLLKMVLWHAAIQVIGFILVFAGFGVAVSFSRQYNKSKNFDSAHQVIGLIIVAALVIQLGLGLVHHSMYARSKKPTPFGRIHFFLGPFIILLGIINGGVGINFAGNHALVKPYAVVVAVLLAIVLLILGILLLVRNRRKFKLKPESKEPEYPPFAHYGNQYGGQHGGQSFEMREPSLGEEPPEPFAYDPRKTYSLDISERAPLSPAIPEPYSAAVPYTPVSAITPTTQGSLRREEMWRYPSAPYREFG